MNEETRKTLSVTHVSRVSTDFVTNAPIEIGRRQVKEKGSGCVSSKEGEITLAVEKEEAVSVESLLCLDSNAVRETV